MGIMATSEAEQVGSLCRLSYIDFVEEFWSEAVQEPLVMNWHMPYLCQQIQEVCEKVFRQELAEDIVCNVSPGTSKSTLFSVLLPAWCLARMPSFKYIGASYTERLALELSRKSRNVIKSEKYQACFPYVKLRKDQDTKHHFVTTKGGMRYAVGAGGAVMGMHAHLIVTDDPLDPTQAASEAELANVNTWMRETLPSRKVDKKSSAMMLVMQRLHQDDPSANASKQANTRKIVIPATLDYPVFPAGLAANYKKGLMDPVRLPPEYLEKERKRMGDHGYSGQYGQSPVPVGGGLFKTARIRLAKCYPHSLDKMPRRTMRFWDKAATAEGTSKHAKRSAWTVGLKMTMFQDKTFFIDNVIRVRVDSAERERLILRTAQEDGPMVSIGIEQEGAGAGKQSAEETVRMLTGFMVRILVPKGDKTLRADPFSVSVNNGQVWVIDNPAWTAEYLEELRFFPYSTYKDQVDASSGCHTLLSQGVTRIGGM